MSETLGNRLLAFCGAARGPLMLVAPFIKEGALARLLAVVPSDVEVSCVTRWRPDEVAAGVSDLEVFELVRARGNARLFLQPHLHAKYYRSGDLALLGSANLTGRALGWTEPSNLELLVATDSGSQDLQQFEKSLTSSMQEADKAVRDAVASAAESLKALQPKAPPWSRDFIAESVFKSTYWLPTCPRPDLLFRVYNETIGDQLLSNTRCLAEQDLSYLAPPLGLSEGAFRGYVGALLRQVRWIQDLDRLTAQGLTDHIAVETIAKGAPAGHDFSPLDLWNVTKEWFIYFFPDQYDRVPAGEMLRKRRKSI